MVKERLFVGPRLHGVDAGTTFGVWTSAEGSRFWRRTIGDALYEFAVYADGHTVIARWAPSETCRVIHNWG